MSTVKANNHQIGQSATATNNFCWYQPSTPDGTVRLAVGNAGATTLDTVTVNSSGNVGIGTSSPGAKLDVVGNIRSQGSAATIFNSFSSTGTTTAANYGSIANTGNTFLWGVDSSAGGAVTGSAAYSTWAGSNAAYPFHLITGATVRATLDSSGNLGLGVTPSAWGSGFKAAQIGNNTTLFNDNGGGSYFTSNAYYDGSQYKYLISAYATNYAQYNGSHQWRTAPSGTAGNAISFTQAMTLDASGNWSVGNTGIGLSNNNSIQYSVSNAQGYITHVNGTSSGQGYWIFGYNGSAIGSITQNGTTGVLYNTSSDQRLKTNVQPAGSAIQSILDFPVDQFDWIADGSHQDFGAVAQKAINYIPEMVSVPADEDEMWGIDWSKAVPRLIKTIQELSAELNELKAKVNA